MVQHNLSFYYFYHVLAWLHTVVTYMYHHFFSFAIIIITMVNGYGQLLQRIITVWTLQNK